ncbi:aspartate aminotransferase [compost metagenome]
MYPSVEGLLGKRTPAGRVLETDLDVVMYLLDEAGVAVLDGAAYGLSPYLRLSFATSMENIEEGCRRIREACAALR